MSKILMPYGSADYATVMNKTALGDPGKVAKLFEDHLNRTEPKATPQAPAKES